jgi:peptide chain release factor subunit 1
MAVTQSLDESLKRLAGLEPSPFPVISLYLDLRANQHGRDGYAAFVRKVLPERLKDMPQQSAERESFEHDIARIQSYLDSDVNRAANGLALYACDGSDLFEVMQFDAPLEQHWLFVGSVPHLYPLARLMNLYPRYAAVLLDTNRARIFVFGLASVEHSQQVISQKTRRHSQGGWSQARYQRHIENFHLQHVKEVIDALDASVRDEQIEHIVAAGSDDALALLREHLPAHLAAKLEATTKLDLSASDAEVLQATMESFRDHQGDSEAERVEALLSAWRSGGLGVAGPEATLTALEMGQVDELVITSSLDTLKPVQRLPDGAAPGPVQAATSAPQGTGDETRHKLSSELVLRAEQTGARIRFIQDPALLADIGGVGALLRFRI